MKEACELWWQLPTEFIMSNLFVACFVQCSYNEEECLWHKLWRGTASSPERGEVCSFTGNLRMSLDLASQRACHCVQEGREWTCSVKHCWEDREILHQGVKRVLVSTGDCEFALTLTAAQ